MSGRLLFSIFLINALSLVLQMVWVRRLMTVFGSTALTVSTVLSVFLTGIALGGYLGGRFVGRLPNGLRTCAGLLAGLGDRKSVV